MTQDKNIRKSNIHPICGFTFTFNSLSIGILSHYDEKRVFVAHSTPHLMQTDSIHVLMIILFAICRNRRVCMAWKGSNDMSMMFVHIFVVFSCNLSLYFSSYERHTTKRKTKRQSTRRRWFGFNDPKLLMMRCDMWWIQRLLRRVSTQFNQNLSPIQSLVNSIYMPESLYWSIIVHSSFHNPDTLLIYLIIASCQ